jgi:hypothetical protein
MRSTLLLQIPATLALARDHAAPQAAMARPCTRLDTNLGLRDRCDRTTGAALLGQGPDLSIRRSQSSVGQATKPLETSTMSMPSVCRSEYGGRWRLCVKDGPRRWAKVPGSIRLVQHASSAAHCDALVERMLSSQPVPAAPATVYAKTHRMSMGPRCQRATVERNQRCKPR